MTTIELTDVTEGKVNGNGAVDKFLETISAQLLVHLRKDDINSAQFAEIYAASINPIFQQAITFVLNKDKVAAEVSLIGKQEDKIDSEIIGQEKTNELIDQQILKMQEEVLYTKEQVLNAQVERQKMEVEIEVLEFQKQKIEQEVEVAKQQVLQSIEQVKLIKEQVLKTAAETRLTDQKAINAIQELELLKEQTTRTQNESDLMLQKVKTEIAQIKDQVDGVDVAGSIGRKNTLMRRQADGFLRDAEQKAAKIMSDLWSIEKSADPAGTPIAFVTGEVTGMDGDQPVPSEDTNGVPSTFKAITEAVNALNDGVKNQG